MNDIVLWSAIAYLIVIHLVLLFVIAKSNVIEKVAIKLGLRQPPPSYYDQMLKYHQRMDASVPQGAVIFLGDSITQALATAAVCSRSINYGIGGQTINQLINAIPIYQSLHRAETIVLTIGINDLLCGALPEAIADRNQRLLSMIPSQSRLVWCAIMPAEQPKISPQTLEICNQTIQELCATRPNCIYLDTWPFLTDETQNLVRECYLSDRLHLGDLGYQRWINALQQVLR